MNYNLFVDESCHLFHDRKSVMCIGYMKVDKDNYENFKNAIFKIKLKHRTPVEIKWRNVSLSRLPLYKELVDFYFASTIDFRCILVKYKDKLPFTEFNQGSPDNFYYNLVFYLLNSAVNPPNSEYRVFMDIKDTRGRDKLKKIKLKLNFVNNHKSPFVFFQHIHSHESEFLQLADLFIGAITYKSLKEDEKENANPAKKKLVEYIEKKSGYLLNEGTEPWENKFNIIDHQPKQHI